MKYLIVTGSHHVQIAADEHEASRLKQAHSFDKVIHLEDQKLPLRAAEPTENNVVAFPGGGGKKLDLNAQVDALEEKLVREAMEATGNNQVQAARLLGITRGALQYKLKRIASRIQQAA